MLLLLVFEKRKGGPSSCRSCQQFVKFFTHMNFVSSFRRCKENTGRPGVFLAIQLFASYYTCSNQDRRDMLLAWMQLYVCLL